MSPLAQLMEKNLLEIWSQRNASTRIELIRSLYTDDAVLYEIDDSITGHDAINNKISGLLSSMPADFIFTLQGPVIVNHNMGKLLWGVGPEGQPPVQLGMDIALFDGNRIRSLYVFLENNPAQV